MATTELVTTGPDPLNKDLQSLFVFGTSGADTIAITSLASGVYRVVLNGQLFPPVAGVTGRVFVDGGHGDDNILVSPGAQSAWLFGGAGDDRLQTVAGNNILSGGDGNDLLIGGKDRDLLMGGLGSDGLIGGDGQDILLAGRTVFDDGSLPGLAALGDLMELWTSSLPYEDRIEEISLTSGFLDSVADDTSSDDLIGAGGQDWFIASVPDRTPDKQDDEFLTPSQP